MAQVTVFRSAQGILASGGNASNGDPVDIVFDAIVSEAPIYEAQPTQIPVEDGSVISDNVLLTPEKVTMKSIVSNTPIDSDGFTSDAEEALISLKEWWRKRDPRDVVTDLQVYKNMVLTNFSPTRDRTTGSVLDFSITMQNIIIAETRTVKVPPQQIAPAQKASGATKEDLGKQATEPKVEKTSLLQKTADLAYRSPGS